MASAHGLTLLPIRAHRLIVARSSLSQASAQQSAEDLVGLRIWVTQSQLITIRGRHVRSITNTGQMLFEGDFHRVCPNSATWPSLLAENPYQKPGLGPRFGITLCNFVLKAGAHAALARWWRCARLRTDTIRLEFSALPSHKRLMPFQKVVPIDTTPNASQIHQKNVSPCWKTDRGRLS